LSMAFQKDGQKNPVVSYSAPPLYCHLYINLGDHPKAAIDDHLKSGH